MENTMMINPRWYSAANVILHFHTDIKYLLSNSTKIARKAEELYIGSVVIKGMEELTKQKSWIQPVSDKEGSPDVRSIIQIEHDGDRANDYAQIDLEILNYEHSPRENLIQFLIRTKFSKKKAYDKKTTIILRIKEKTKLPSKTKWANSLKNFTSKPAVIVLGRTHPTEPEYTIFQVYPEYYELIDFNLLEIVSKNENSIGTINIKRGTKKLEILKQNEQHCPFENLGIKCCFKW